MEQNTRQNVITLAQVHKISKLALGIVLTDSVASKDTWKTTKFSEKYKYCTEQTNILVHTRKFTFFRFVQVL